MTERDNADSGTPEAADEARKVRHARVLCALLIGIVLIAVGLGQAWAPLGWIALGLGVCALTLWDRGR